MSLGEEAVLAASGREGEIVAGVGRVRSLGFLNSLQALPDPARHRFILLKVINDEGYGLGAHGGCGNCAAAAS